tara:strand:- start:4823 stop:5836 length:1014 start_codon:yes stop_codon:yes gene_type:complete
MNIVLIYKHFNYKGRPSGMANLVKELKGFLDKNNKTMVISLDKTNNKNLRESIKLKKPFILKTAIKLRKEKGITIIFNTIENSLKAFLYYLIIRLLNKKRKIILYQGTLIKNKSFSKLFLNLFDKVICVSPYIYQKVRRITKKKVSYIPPGLNLKKIDKIREVKNNNKIRIGFFGHFKKHKGSHILTKAFTQLKNENYELILAGKGPLEKRLKKISKDFPNVIIYNYLKNIKEVIKSCDIVCLPFLKSDRILGLALTGIEAKAIGKVLIGTKAKAISQIIKDNEDGFIVKNKKELKEKIKLLCENPRLLKIMSEKAKANSKEFDINKVGKLFLKEIS